jgi:hypothetical protein
MAEKLGVGSADIAAAKVKELNDPASIKNAVAEKNGLSGGKVRQLAQYIAEDSACSACYAALVFALSRMDRKELDRLGGKVAIGQGFRGKPDSGKNGGGQSLGIGRCTSGFTAFCPGCSPSGAEV